MKATQHSQEAKFFHVLFHKKNLTNQAKALKHDEKMLNIDDLKNEYDAKSDDKNNEKNVSFSSQNENLALKIPEIKEVSKSSEIIASISHEMKTPISAMIGISDILKDNLFDIIKSLEGKIDAKSLSLLKESQDLINDAGNVAVDLDEIAHDLLDVCAFKDGDFTVNLKQKIDICAIIKRVKKLNSSYSLRRKVLIELDLDENIPEINLDAKRMKQILTNLTSNALKYSPRDTKTIISAKVLNGNLEVKISDQGFGMSDEEVKIAFDKGKTFNNPNSGKVDSFGLGLFLVKKLVEKQKGIISIFSKKNIGTEISLIFPIF
jgi:signal transduction histidine kinase